MLSFIIWLDKQKKLSQQIELQLNCKNFPAQSEFVRIYKLSQSWKNFIWKASCCKRIIKNITKDQYLKMIKLFVILMLFVAFAHCQYLSSEEAVEDNESFERRLYFNNGPKYPSCLSYLDCRPDEFCVSYRRMIAGRCVTRTPEGSSCTSGTTCLSGNCSWFRCKGKPIV